MKEKQSGTEADLIENSSKESVLKPLCKLSQKIL